MQLLLKLFELTITLFDRELELTDIGALTVYLSP